MTSCHMCNEIEVETFVFIDSYIIKLCYDCKNKATGIFARNIIFQELKLKALELELIMNHEQVAVETGLTELREKHTAFISLELKTLKIVEDYFGSDD